VAVKNLLEIPEGNAFQTGPESEKERAPCVERLTVRNAKYNLKHRVYKSNNLARNCNE